jgi:hypothetical protein
MRKSSLNATRSGTGIPVAEIVKAHLIRSHAPVSAAAAMMSPEERETALDELFDSVPTPAGIREEAFHREHWYS